MGSSGSGRISDYPGSSPPPEEDDNRESDTGGGGESASGRGNGGGVGDRCSKAFATQLEDVEHSDYFQAKGHGPAVGTSVILVHQKRLIAATASGESIGNLPTTLNYLAGCMKGGWKYVGTVTNVSAGRNGIIVYVDFVPSQS